MLNLPKKIIQVLRCFEVVFSEGFGKDQLGAGQMEKSERVFLLFLPTHQETTRAIDPRMCSLHHPSPHPKAGVVTFSHHSSLTSHRCLPFGYGLFSNSMEESTSQQVSLAATPVVRHSQPVSLSIQSLDYFSETSRENSF